MVSKLYFCCETCKITAKSLIEPLGFFNMVNTEALLKGRALIEALMLGIVATLMAMISFFNYQKRALLIFFSSLCVLTQKN